MRRAIVAMVALLLVPFGGTALADEGEATVAGTGWLAARGTGTATLDMGGWIVMRIDGNLTINDFDGNLKVRIASAGEAETAEGRRGPEIVLNDFRGYLAARGSHFLFRAEGTMEFLAHGTGFAYLEGEGVYKTRRGRPNPWGDGPIRLAS